MYDPETVTIQGSLARSDVRILTRYCEGQNVVEFGMGGSTLLLARCAKSLVSYDSDPVWVEKTAARVAQIPDKACSPKLLHAELPNSLDTPGGKCDVLFIDGRPDLRKMWVERFAPHAKVVICHDSRSDGNYSVLAGFSLISNHVSRIDLHDEDSNMLVATMCEPLQEVPYENSDPAGTIRAEADTPDYVPDRSAVVPGSRSLAIDFDDAHWWNPWAKAPQDFLDDIEKIVSDNAGIKFTLFATPLLGGKRLIENAEWCDRMRKLIDAGTVALGFHGLTHDANEYAPADRGVAKGLIEKAQREFDDARLPVHRIFRAPFWQLSQLMVDVAAESGFTHCFVQFGDLKWLKPGPMKPVCYNWNLSHPTPPPISDLVAHGHTHDTCNNWIRKAVGPLSTIRGAFKFGHEL